MSSPIHSQAGMTLAELMVVMVALGLLSASIVGFTMSKTIESARATVRANLLANAHMGLDRMANDIRLSSKADNNNRWPDTNSPNSPSNDHSWASNSTTLVLASAAQKTNGTILFDDVADYITTKNNYVYFLKNNTLYKRILAAPVADNSAKTTCPSAIANSSCPADKIVLTDISSFSIQYYDNLNQLVSPDSARSVQLTVQLSKKSFGDTITAKYTTRMVFRNG